MYICCNVRILSNIKVLILQAEKEAQYLEHWQTEKTLTSLRDRVKKLTNENAALLDRLRKFGALQLENHQLGTKVAELQGQLEKVSAEREEMKGLLELAQAQVYTQTTLCFHSCVCPIEL